jgi:biopolymer transport protein ExbB
METSLMSIFFTGGWVMWPLLILSVLSWAVVLERTYVFLTLRPRLRRLAQSIMQSLRSGDLATAKQICHRENPELAQIFLSTIDRKRSREATERITDRNKARLAGHLKKNLWILGTIGSASPFIGLLGTVVGIIRSFTAMAEKGTGGFAVVSAGISEALIATAAGLVVAIIALMAYNVFTTAANQTLTQIRLSLEELIEESFDQAATSMPS